MIPTTKGKLYLVPAPLDFGCETQAPLQDVMPLATLQVAARLPCWICENAKSTRAYLKRINDLQPLASPVQSLQIQELPRDVHKKGDHHGNFDARPLLIAAMEGRDMGLVSEAGMPAIADPGSSVVRAAHDAARRCRVPPPAGNASGENVARHLTPVVIPAEAGTQSSFNTLLNCYLRCWLLRGWPAPCPEQPCLDPGRSLCPPSRMPG